MAQHKWHKEIKHWADGGEIQYSNICEPIGTWIDVEGEPYWNNDEMEYRIKPQPKEPQYLKVYGWLENQNITFSPIADYPYIGKIKLETE